MRTSKSSKIYFNKTYWIFSEIYDYFWYYPYFLHNVLEDIYWYNCEFVQCFPASIIFSISPNSFNLAGNAYIYVIYLNNAMN